MKDEIKTCAEDVKVLLETYPMTRDSDERLYALYTMNYLQSKNVDIYSMSALRLLSKMKRGELPKFESVSRARRKLQEEYEELRGEKYNARHKEEVEVRDAVKNNDLI